VSQDSEGAEAPGEVLHGSDQGCACTSEQLETLPVDDEIKCGMSKRGDYWGNAAMERFFSTLKAGRLSRRINRFRERATGQPSVLVVQRGA
jgi:transposase InsO family protein